MATRIYTKTGDKGQTSLIGGTRLPKHHQRIEAYGTVDELNSNIGLLRDLISPAHEEQLLAIQDRLFTMGSNLAADPEKNKMQLPQLFEEDITALEKSIDDMNGVLPEMKSFVLPGGHPHVSHCHIVRCVCRRASTFFSLTRIGTREQGGSTSRFARYDVRSRRRRCMGPPEPVHPRLSGGPCGSSNAPLPRVRPSIHEDDVFAFARDAAARPARYVPLPAPSRPPPLPCERGVSPSQSR